MPNLTAAIAFIRQARDELRREFCLWEPQLELWRDLAPVRSAKAERAVVYLYRFLARQYPADQLWTSHA